MSSQPAMRPSAAQLLQHERVELAFKVSGTEKLCVGQLVFLIKLNLASIQAQYDKST